MAENPPTGPAARIGGGGPAWVVATSGCAAVGCAALDRATLVAACGTTKARSRRLGGSLVATKDFTVAGSHRNTPGQVEVHARETDIFYVTDGEATRTTESEKAAQEMAAQAHDFAFDPSDVQPEDK